MKKNKISLKIIMIFIIIVVALSIGKVYASTNIQDMLEKVEYSEEYKKWLELSDEEKSKVIKPKMFDTINQQSNTNYLKSINNVLRTSQLLKATLTDKYTLQTVIKDNVKIRNQMNTNSCWAFATMGALETHLALKDNLDSKPVTIYDYSEKHMNYATTRENFLNNKINENGFPRQMSDGGNFEFARVYLTNGTGAVQEKQVPFEDSEDKIDISVIQNAKVETTLYDTVEFEQPTDLNKNDLIIKMKEHITNYGGIYAGVFGSELLSDNYNNQTGAIYCKNSILTPSNHAVTIIGWDDNYEKTKFNEKNQPNENGAWIVKNSWGENIKENLKELKEAIYEANQEDCEEYGWNNANAIPDDFVIQSLEEMGYGKGKVKKEGEELVVEIGDKGYMYISYEDDNIYRNLAGIEKAVPSKDYFKLYQNDVLGASTIIRANLNGSVYLANVFKRDSSQKEQLDKISLYTTQGYTCKVYVNPNGSDKSLSSLQQVKLAAGETESFEAGYHTIEFAEPIQLNADTFTVVVEIMNNSAKDIAIEKIDDTYWKNAEVNEGESFITDANSIKNGEWEDLAIVENEDIRGNVTIKAFTQQKEEVLPKSPTSSNFDNSNAELTDVQHYFYTKDFDNSYSKIRIKVSNIKLGDENNTYTYYYYLSGTQGDENILEDNWKKINVEKQKDGTYSMVIDINSKDIPNYNEISQSDNLYIYIKEIAELDGNKVQKIKTLPIENKSTQTFYLDGNKMNNLDDVLNKINEQEKSSSNNKVVENKSGSNNKIVEDNTKAKLSLPQTGIISIIIIAFVVIIVMGYSYYRYKNIDR